MARVLFIDDDPSTLETYTKAVELFGHRAILADTAEKALEIAAAECPDLIILDVRMPDMDGFELLTRLREGGSTASIPVVMLSAGAEMDAADQAQAAGAVEYLSKPIRLNKLIDTIQQYTEN